MYEEHPEFTPPPKHAALWRYMDFTKFVSLISKESLFFPRADKLGDPFEGSTSPVNIALHPIVYKDEPPHIRAQMPTIMESMRRFFFISCWHWNEFESDAMWTLYARQSDGIAIKTDFQSFAESITDTEDIHIGKINYVDYEKIFIPEANMFSKFLHKRISFEHEHEVRAVAMRVPEKDITQNLAVSHWPDICEVGQYYEIDLSKLVHQIVVAPFAGDWLVELVQSVTDKYGLKVPVARSPLGNQPIWG